MHISFGQAPIPKQQASDYFTDVIEQKIRDHFYTECLLDEAGIQRVMPLLRAVYVTGFRTLYVNFTAEAGETIPGITMGASSGDDKPDPSDQEVVRALAQHIADETADLLDDNQLNMLLAMATVLAAFDEKLHKRPRH